MKRSKRKALGQHFLADPRIRRRIIKAIAPDPDDIIIEIGAGKGALTYALASKAGKVIAIEKDSSLVRLLQETSLPNVSILEKDVLGIDFKKLVKEKSIKVCFQILKKETLEIAAHGYGFYVMINIKTGKPEKIPDMIIQKYSI